MIQNEHQYKVTQGEIKKLQQAVATMLENTEMVSPDQVSVVQASFQQQIDRLQAPLQEYDDLKAGKRTITMKSIEDLPKVLIQKRISLGMTQRELSEKLGIKEQMVQRYESTGYESISFQRLTEIWNTLNASIPEITVRSVVASPIQEQFSPQNNSKNFPHRTSNGKTISQLSRPKIDSIPGIEKTPGVCGGSACIAGTRITVWGLVGSQRIGYSEVDLLTSYPTLSATNLANAWAYAAAFPSEIEAEIAENNEVMDGEV